MRMSYSHTVWFAQRIWGTDPAPTPRTQQGLADSMEPPGSPSVSSHPFHRAPGRHRQGSLQPGACHGVAGASHSGSAPCHASVGRGHGVGTCTPHPWGRGKQAAGAVRAPRRRQPIMPY